MSVVEIGERAGVDQSRTDEETVSVLLLFSGFLDLTALLLVCTSVPTAGHSFCTQHVFHTYTYFTHACTIHSLKLPDFPDLDETTDSESDVGSIGGNSVVR